MRRFSANYIFPVSGNPIRNGIVEVNDDGTISEIIHQHEAPEELANTEFHNGIIVPGFVNTHCHTELSHLKDRVSKGVGISGFVKELKGLRSNHSLAMDDAIRTAIEKMYIEGISAVADICNSTDSFIHKQNNPMRFYNLIEVLGLDGEKSESIWDRALILQSIAKEETNNPTVITPHSTYSLSEKLWIQLSGSIGVNDIVSIHFAESKEEIEYTSMGTGPLEQVFRSWGLPKKTVANGTPIEVVKKYIPINTTILFVHNTFLSQFDIGDLICSYPNASFCLCPQSNLFIEKELPDVPALIAHNAKITLGTDSLASSGSLSIIEQMKTIAAHFPSVGFSQMLPWATLNGAMALGFDEELGSIEIGKKPGLVLIAPFDFKKMQLLPNSKGRRLV
jgi:cytosine/adenosine deaminase-related metal-dependent hydrolase